VKNKAKYILQKTMGFSSYLFVFAIFKIKTLRSDKKEKDFFHFLNLIPKSQEGIILDIGANLGIMTYHLSKSFPETTIHAFEPIPHNVNILKKIITKYHLLNVKLHDFALGLTQEKIKMVLPTQNKVMFQGLSHVKHDSITEMNEGIEFEVDMNFLDNLYPNETIKAIKIDVENFEYFVLKGGENLIQQNKPIIYAELWENENRVNCFSFLSELGYQTYISLNYDLVLFNPAQHKKQNFIFIAN
jgi:FkbM family methyltransferase